MHRLRSASSWPAKSPDGRWRVAQDGNLGRIRGGHCVCLAPARWPRSLMRRRAAAGALGAAALLGAAAVALAAQPPSHPPPASAPPPSTSAPNALCHRVRDVLPDPACTPGASLPDVTPAEVCTPGWSAAHRHVPASVRRDVLARYGGAPAGPYELDHLISLELGGTNDPANLWPQPGRIPNGKDRIENRLHRLVCAGRLELAEAQRRIAEDWTSAG